MRNSLLSGTVAAAGLVGLSAGVAMAADMPVKAPVISGYSWAGFYVGANGGYSVGRDASTLTNLTNPPPGALNLFRSWNEVPVGPIGGVQAGFNWQSNNWVFGLEADIQASGQRDSSCLICDPALGTFAVDQRLAWFGTVRGRLGWAAGPVLSYVTGGFAYGRVETDVSLTITGFPTTAISTHENKSGWTVGSGVEAALIGNWTAKVEYLYLSLGTTTTPFFNSGTGATRTAYSGNIRDHIVRVGLNYRVGSTSGSGAAISAPAPFSNWSGFYAGLNTGYGVGRNPTTLAVFVNGAPQTADAWKESPAGWLAGVQAGYNWQTGNLVLGLEADIQGSRLTDSACMVVCTAGAFTDVVDQKISWFATLRGRGGFAAGPALFYVTGGFAYARVETTVTESIPGAGVPTVAASVSGIKSGWTVGGGAEIAVSGNWTAKTEYLYMDLGSVALSFNNNIAAGPLVVAHALDSRIRTHIFRSGLSYRFNPPVVARY